MARFLLAVLVLLASSLLLAGARPLQEAEQDSRRLQQWQQQWGPRPYTPAWYAKGGWIGLQGAQPPEPVPAAQSGRALKQWQQQWGPRPFTSQFAAKGGWVGLRGANGSGGAAALGADAASSGDATLSLAGGGGK